MALSPIALADTRLTLHDLRMQIAILQHYLNRYGQYDTRRVESQLMALRIELANRNLENAR